MNKTDSYCRCLECGTDCIYLSIGEEPCYGNVTADYYGEEVIHTCEGHTLLTYYPKNETGLND